MTCAALLNCREIPGSARRVNAEYDKASGKLSRLTIDGNKDGEPAIFSFMDGSRFVRIEIDQNKDGSVDRWEYFGADGALEKVGVSRANDGIVDTWLFQGPDGLPAKVEMSTRRAGSIDRTEFYERGELTRVELDTDADGRVDKWETYAGGSLTKVSFDVTKSGNPTVTIDYQQEQR
jgi:hypothetical protein